MKRVYVGGALTGVAAIVATWVAIGVGAGGGASSCPLPAFPSASCTGVPSGTSLTSVSGNLDLTTATTVDGKDVQGCVLVRKPGTVIKNSSMQCIIIIDDAALPGAARLTVSDSDINCDSREGGFASDVTGIRFRNFTLRRVDITNCENGVAADVDFTIQDSYIHDLYQCPIAGCPEPGSPHVDGVEISDGSNSLIVHNTIYAVNDGCTPPSDGTCNGTSAINYPNITGGGGPVVKNATVIYNLLMGGSYAMYCPIHTLQPAPVNFKITANRWNTTYKSTVGENGPSNSCGDGDEILQNNVYYPSGLPIALG